MQYFKLELLKDDSSDVEWENNSKAYYNKFLQCCDNLPTNLTNILKTDAFHDALIQEIALRKEFHGDEFKFNVVIVLKYKGKIGKLVHYGVQEFHSTLKNLGEYIEFGDYLYGEILQDEHEFWIHNFLLLDSSEINIKCEKIEYLGG